jgi:hypothetical protein
MESPGRREEDAAVRRDRLVVPDDVLKRALLCARRMGVLHGLRLILTGAAAGADRRSVGDARLMLGAALEAPAAV